MGDGQARPRWLVGAALWAGVVVVVVGGFVIVQHRAERDIEARIVTLGEVAKHYPSARAFRISTGFGEVYECVLPEPVGVLASGPPACTFDAKGQRIRWTADDGDAPEYVKGVRSGVRTAVELEVIVREVGGGGDRAK